MDGTRDLQAPVAYVQTPVTAKPKSTCQSILGFFGAETGRLTLPQLIRQVADSLDDHGTKALILDDITRLRMHRADDQDTLDLIHAFMSMNVISDTTCTTDHHHRRISLTTWTLPQRDWATIWGQVTPRLGTTQPHDSSRKHQAASEFVWSRVTGRERALAPLTPALPPQLRHRKHWGSIAYSLAGPGQNTHYAQLKPLLTEYADQLASTIDSNEARV